MVDLQVKFQILKMQHLDERKQQENENEGLKIASEKQTREIEDKEKQIKELEVVVYKAIEVPGEIISSRPPTRTYTFFLKEQWVKCQLV
jgi:hypothetical protein